ncbi:dihydrolipoamide acetyltransferase family protein [Candidatus Uabimicrobium sp. HlEnr_7]|uniref:dihydrolipoamide acetyltransferase family protein n=1 Tax=Candidatus Uabimicrobium helgolandensis TaxID=3095367 RepID=UPI003556B6FD
MPFVFKFPDIGEGITEGKILEWYVEVGQQIKSDAKVVKMETDKVVDDIPSPRTGTVIARYGNEGDVIDVGQVLIEIQVEGESASTPTPKKEEKKKIAYGVVGNLEVASDNDVLPSSSEGSAEQVVATSTKKKILATPAVRALARRSQIDIQQVKGTGPNGRVTKKDIQEFTGTKISTSVPIASREPISIDKEASVTIESLSQIRKTIAKRMLQSKQVSAHMTVFEEIEVSELEDLRKSQKQKFKERGTGLSYLPFIIKAVVASLKANPVLNSQMDLANDRLIYKHQYNIGIAVDTPSGLVVPVIRNADQKSIFELSVAIQDLATRGRERKLSRNEFQDGTFTISNFGSIAGIYGTPILNQPEVAILGVGRARQMPVVKNDELAIGRILPLSLSVDHCLIDGGDATRFLKGVMDLLNDPMALLMM